jgi:RNA recognition motif-containing protein
MVTHDDLMNDNEFKEIREDVRLECEEFGPVVSVVIPRIKDGYPPSTEGYIYVEFSHVETARIAGMALNGRKFADRTVQVNYVSFLIVLTLFSLISVLFIYSMMNKNLLEEYSSRVLTAVTYTRFNYSFYLCALPFLFIS